MNSAQPHSNASHYHPLSRRPQATTITVWDLLGKAQKGEIRVPEFQRPLRWRSEDVRKLLDSIWRGYPIGSLLFWKRPADAGFMKLGGAHIEVPAIPDAWWVVDGQQRITALVASLLDLDQGSDTRWILRFDPRTESFLSGPVLPSESGFQVPLSVLGDMKRLVRWMRSSGLDEEGNNKLEDALARILGYAIPAYIIDTDDEEPLRAVFARMNSTGVKMRADEVFQALLGRSGEQRESLDLDVLQRGCSALDFGEPPRAEILKAVLAMSGQDPNKRLEHLGEHLPKMVTMAAAEEALGRTVTFLIQDAGIPHVSLIPYPVVFVILARWFFLYPDSASVIRSGLARWLWRGAATGAHQRAAVSKMRQQVRDLKPDDEFGSLTRLLKGISAPPVNETWTLERFNLKGARSRIEALALWSLGPREPDGSIPLSRLLAEGERFAREILRSSEWRELDEDTQTLAQTAANRILLDGVHSGLASTLRRWPTGPGTDGALSSHLLEPEMMEALARRDLPQFLRLRSDAVSRLVEQFLTVRTQWGAPLLAPIDVYLDPPYEEEEA